MLNRTTIVSETAHYHPPVSVVPPVVLPRAAHSLGNGNPAPQRRVPTKRLCCKTCLGKACIGRCRF